MRAEEPVDDDVVLVRGAPLDEASLGAECALMARRFQFEGAPLRGFSVEAVSQTWPLARVLREGRVRTRRCFAVCTVGDCVD